VAALGGVVGDRCDRCDRLGGPLHDVRPAVGARSIGGQRSNAHGDVRVIVVTETAL
jgi:hypothetical protein